MSTIAHRYADVDGFNVFYREAGRPGAPKLLMLHGFPSSSHMFRDLIPLLSERFHIVAPDLPGFGQSDLPGRDDFAYTSNPAADFKNDVILSDADAVLKKTQSFLARCL